MISLPSLEFPHSPYELVFDYIWVSFESKNLGTFDDDGHQFLVDPLFIGQQLPYQVHVIDQMFIFHGCDVPFDPGLFQVLLELGDSRVHGGFDFAHSLEDGVDEDPFSDGRCHGAAIVFVESELGFKPVNDSVC